MAENENEKEIIPKTPETQSETPPEVPEKKSKKRVRLCIVLCAVLVFVCAVLGTLQLGSWYTGRRWEQWSPDYEKTDITGILKQETLSESDYETLYRQTGLTAIAIDDMRTSAHGMRQILAVQKFLFEKHEVTSRKFTIFTYMEEMDEYAPLAYLQDGDIIVTSTTRVSWWAYGHAALVVDGADGVIVESLSPGTKSQLGTVKQSFAYLGDFIILRPKIDAKTKAQIVEYAKENLVGLPYQMTTGIFTKKYSNKPLKTTQCAHLVWHAYKKFGYDLDSNGGAVVKPQDIARSEYVEVVQAFGFDLDELWN